MAFVRRYINISFSRGGKNVDVKGLRVSATILYSGIMQMGVANVLVYGLSRSQLQALSSFGERVIVYPDFSMSITAGDAVNGMSLVFVGKVVNAWADMQTAPGVVMHIEAKADMTAQVKPTGESDSATSYKGEVPAATILSELAGKAGLSFENNGVTELLYDTYHFGSVKEQILDVMHAARLEGIIENGKLAVWPAQGSRAGTIEISKETGMVGIPGFTVMGVVVKTLFKRHIPYGSLMHVKSDVVMPPGNGVWRINRVDYRLESQVPRGDWFATLWGTNPSLGAVGQ